MTNRALGNGGAIDSWLSSIAVDSSLFLSNVASQDGGAIKVGDSNLTLCDCRLENNTATYGGGVAVHDSNLTMTNVHFINNEAHYHGGAVHADDSNVIMEAALLMNNSAINGGALSLDNEDRAVVTTSTFHSNFARDRGGAIAVRWRSTITINDSNIYNNTATWGTAISNCNGCTEISDLTGAIDPIFTYCTIYEGDNDSHHHVINDRLDIWCSANASLSPIVNETPLSTQETLTKWSSTFLPTDNGNLTEDESTTIIPYYGNYSDATTTYLAISIVTDVSTEFPDKCSSTHSDTGYIVAIVIVSMLCLILIGYIAFIMGSHQMQSLLTSKSASHKRASHEAKIDPLKMVNNEQKFGKYSEEESLTSTCDSVKL